MPTEPVLNPSACAPIDVALDAAVATLEHLPVLVDEEVVAKVVPAVSLHVVHLDRPNDRRRLRRRVRVRARGVMDHREPERLREHRAGPSDLLVRAPACARDQRGRACDRKRARRHRANRALDEVRAQTRHPAAKSVLDRVRGADPVRVAEPPLERGASLGRARVRHVERLRLRRSPRGPAAGDRARSEEHVAGAAPVQADEVEHRRARARERASARRRAAPPASRAARPRPAQRRERRERRRWRRGASRERTSRVTEPPTSRPVGRTPPYRILTSEKRGCAGLFPSAPRSGRRARRAAPEPRPPASSRSSSPTTSTRSRATSSRSS